MKFPLLITALFTALLFACTQKAPVPEHAYLTGRPSPAYIQWLEGQAFLRKATEITSVVSGSSLSWRHGSRAPLLPKEARVWFSASPALTAWAGQNSFLSALEKKGMTEKLADMGIDGLYLHGMADTGDEWQGLSPDQGLGEDAASFPFGRVAGRDEEYQALLSSLARAKLLIGGSLLPANPGMGPDFFLASRAVRDYPGLYAMLEVPHNAQHILPELEEHEYAALCPRQTEALAAQGVMAPALVQDAYAISQEAHGWAATGPIVGVDGVKRRWIYRFFAYPRRPVLHWDDPSGAAMRIMEASLIEQAGLKHQALVGLYAAAWMGLDAVHAGELYAAEDELEPGLSALSVLARNAHRYGAALIMEDSLPMERLAALQRTGVDFCFDSVLFPALEKSLLIKSAEPVRRSLRASLRMGVEHKALWRAAADGLPRPGGEELLSLMPEGWAKILQRHDRQKYAPRINAITLAAASAGTAPGKAPDAADICAIEDAHMLQIAVRAFLPGLLMISGADLSGALPQGEDWPATPPLWHMDAAPSSRQGLPSGLALYQLPAGSDAEHKLKSIMAARKSCNIAMGRLTHVPECGEKSVLIMVSALPSGANLAFLGNFSEKKTIVAPNFPQWNNASHRIDSMSQQRIFSQNIPLPAWGWKAFLLY